jgi:two-component system, sensor histidine kinase and response regulator
MSRPLRATMTPRIACLARFHETCRPQICAFAQNDPGPGGPAGDRWACHEMPAGDGMDTPQLLSEAQAKRALVAEDELVAQKVARRCLEAMGYAVVVVGDGAAAVNAYAQHGFGLVLMDLQMEQMDGLQAAREIRRQERRPGRRVPIFGLSASAARDELVQCTAAGMDGLLIKPLQRARLHQALLEFGLVGPGKGPAGAEAPSCSVSVEQAADLVTLRAKFEGDTAFVHRLCQTFLTSVGPLLSELGRAAAAGERPVVRALAHRIKGAGTNIHAHRVATLAARIESGSASMALSELSQAVGDLGRAFDETATCISSELQ